MLDGQGGLRQAVAQAALLPQDVVPDLGPYWGYSGWIGAEAVNEMAGGMATKPAMNRPWIDDLDGNEAISPTGL